MVAKIIIISLVCILCAADLVTSQNDPAPPSSPTKPDELQLKPDAQTENNNNNNNPLANDNQNANDGGQIQPQTDLTTPLTSPYDDPHDMTLPKLSDFFPPIFNIFGQNRNNQQGPPARNPISYLLSNQLFDRRLQEMSQQAEEGQQVEYLTRNGVSYMRTCTTKRV